MGKTVYGDYEGIYQLNLDLLEMVKQEKWEEFIQMAEVYITQLHEVLANQPDDILPEEKSNLAVILGNLLENEDEIEKTLRNRLDVLKKEMSSLHRGKKGSEAYSTQFTSAFH